MVDVMVAIADVPVLVARALTLTRGARTLFADLSFQISAGEALILRGANGVGKTSLIRVLAGLTEADEGNIAIKGEIVKPLAVHQRNSVLAIGHANQLKDDFTTLENLADQLQLDAITADQDAQLQALSHVGLLDRRHVLARRLSQGQKRRIGLARLRLSDKPIWLLDEPTNALDADGVALFVEMVDAHLARGGAAVIATHLLLPLAGVTHELQMREVVGVVELAESQKPPDVPAQAGTQFSQTAELRVKLDPGLRRGDKLMKFLDTSMAESH